MESIRVGVHRTGFFSALIVSMFLFLLKIECTRDSECFCRFAINVECFVSRYVKWNETKKFYEEFACNGSDTEKFPDHTAVTEVVLE